MSFLGAIGGAVGGALGNKLFGQSSGSRRRQARRNQEAILQQMKVGNQLDLDNQKSMFNYRMQQGAEMGLTPVELFGSPASGSGGGTTGSGSTLGNSMSQQQMQGQQLDQQFQQQMQTLGVQAATQLEQTQMQTDAQRDVAEIQAGVQERGQDIQAMIANNKLELDRRQLEEIAIPDLQNKTNLNAEQIKVAINEAANTDPAWVRKKTVMQLGVDNGIQNLILGKLNLDLTNPEQIQSLTDQQYSDALTALLSASSAIGKNSAAVENIIDRIFDTVKAEEQRRAMERGSKMLGSPNPQGGFQARQLGNGGPVPAGTPKYHHFNRDFPGR